MLHICKLLLSPLIILHGRGKKPKHFWSWTNYCHKWAKLFPLNKTGREDSNFGDNQRYLQAKKYQAFNIYEQFHHSF